MLSKKKGKKKNRFLLSNFYSALFEVCHSLFPIRASKFDFRSASLSSSLSRPLSSPSISLSSDRKKEGMTASSAQPDANNPLEALSSAARGAVEALATALARLPLPVALGMPRRQKTSSPSSSTAAAAAAGRAAAAPTLRASSSSPTFPGARSAAAAAAAASFHRVSKEELGRATWTLLHSVAAALPETPTRPQRRAFCQLVHSLAELYPCAECAEHFGRIVDARPPERAAAAGGEAARLWCCDAHNDVNERVGKPRFDCSLVGARWAGLDCGDGEDGRSSGCELAGPGAGGGRRRKA